MPNLNYRHLRYFRAVALEGSLTRAAQHLNLSQSALSAQIQTLERQLGHALFDRVGRRLELTEAGRIALEYANTVFEAGHDLLGTLQGRRSGAIQRVAVGALTTLSRNFQMGFLRPLIGRHDVALTLRSGTLPALIADLEAHALDVVLATGPADRAWGHALVSHLLSQQPVSLVGRPAPGQTPLRFPVDLAGLPVLLPGRDSDMRAAFGRALEQAGITPLVLAEVDDMAMLRLLARDSGVLALVPPIVVRDELAAGVLVERCRLPDVTETFYAIVQQRRFPNPLIADLLAQAKHA